MKTIWKFPIRIADTQCVQMPTGAIIHHVAFQGDELCLWALVESLNPISTFVIEVFGTGHPIPDGPRKLIGTVLQKNGALVWHIFEQT